MAVKVLIKRKVTEDQARKMIPLFKQMRVQANNQPGYISGETLKRLDQDPAAGRGKPFVKTVMHHPGQGSEFFPAEPLLGMRSDKQPQAHDGAGKRPAGAAGLTHAAAEAGTKLLGLLGSQPAVKTVIKYQQK